MHTISLITVTVNNDTENSVSFAIPKASVNALKRNHSGSLARQVVFHAFTGMKNDLEGMFKSGNEGVTGPELLPENVLILDNDRNV